MEQDALFFKNKSYSEARAAHIGSLSALEAMTRSIGMPQVAFESINQIYDLPPGIKIQTTGPHTFRYFSSRLRTVIPTPTGSVFMQSWDDVDYVVTKLTELKQLISESPDLTRGAREAELDNLKKAVLETGHSGSGHISLTMSRDEGVGMPGMKEFFDWLLTECGPIPSDFTLDTTVVKGTSHGWPSYVSGADSLNDVDLLAHTYLAGALIKVGGYFDAFEELVRREIVSPKEPFSALMFFRTGPMSKPQEHFELMDDKLHLTGTSQGVFCRARQVAGVPTCVNIALRPASVRVKTLLRRNYSFKHGAANVTQATINNVNASIETAVKKAGSVFALLQSMGISSNIKEDEPFSMVWKSEDISGYDASVDYQMQMDLANNGYSKVLSPVELIMYKQLQELPILAPPITSDSEAFLYHRKGRTISGSIFTTNDGTILNAGRIAYGLSRAYEMSISDVWRLKGKLWDTIILGDDCSNCYVNLTPSRLLAYQMASRELGFKTDLFDGVVFLMTSYGTGDIAPQGILSRAVSKTFFRERPSSSSLVDLLGLHARWSRCVHHPLFTTVWNNVMAKNRALNSLGVSSFDELDRLVSSASFQRLLLMETNNPLVRKDLAEFLTALGRGDLQRGLSLGSVYLRFYGDRLKPLLLTSTPATTDLLLSNFEHPSQKFWKHYFQERESNVNINPDKYLL